MKTLNERLRNVRIRLHLSQEYVSRFIGVNTTSVAEIENGGRPVSDDELTKYSELFLIPVDELINGRANELPAKMFAGSFDKIDKSDQREILNVLEFKKKMME